MKFRIGKLHIDVERWNIALYYSATPSRIFVLGWVHDKDGWFWSWDLIDL